MSISRPLYIFRQDLSACTILRNQYPGLLSLWIAGENSILKGFQEALCPSPLILEEELADAVDLHNWGGAQVVMVPSESRREIDRHLSNSQMACVLVSNDTHARLFAPLMSSGIRVGFRFSPIIDEGADQALRQLGLKFRAIGEEDVISADALIVANDWGPVESFWIQRFRRAGKPTMCLQESVIRFGGRARRMKSCDYPLLQGMVSALALDRDLMFLTGNPRYQDLNPTSLPSEFRVLINCNFTYGVYDGQRQSWMADVVNACKRVGVQHLVAQHPRDRGTLDGVSSVRTDAGTIHGLLRGSSLLVTRFSSLIHEAVALGRPVVYFNPHGEDMGYDFEFDAEHLISVTDPSELADAIMKIRRDNSQRTPDDPFYSWYAARHFGPLDGLASERVAQAVKVIMANRVQRRPDSRTGAIAVWLRYHKTRVFRTLGKAE